MMHNEKKLAKIVEELTMFFFAVEATDIHSAIQIQGHCGSVTFDSDYGLEYEEKLASLKKYLSEPRNEAMEDFYWELAGSGDPGESGQLLLLGMMTDEAEVEIKEHRVWIRLVKKLDR